VQEKGDYIRTRLTDAGYAVSGLGLMIGIETKKPVAEVLAACMEKGVLCLSAKEKLRLLPPLNIPWPHLIKAVDVIIRSF
jgi:acetylornithine/N-succinyldiaminopimelate aminotransferase